MLLKCEMLHTITGRVEVLLNTSLHAAMYSAAMVCII